MSRKFTNFREACGEGGCVGGRNGAQAGLDRGAESIHRQDVGSKLCTFENELRLG